MKARIAAIAGLAGSAATAASADVIVIPSASPAGPGPIPFGCGTAAAPLNHAIMHQAVNTLMFDNLTGGAPVTITDIGFACGVAGQYNSSVTLRLGYTNRVPGQSSPAGLSIPDPGGGGAPNASGPMTTFYSNAAYTATIPAPSTTEFGIVHFPGSFLYDPALGHLLIEVVNDATFGNTVDLTVSYGGASLGGGSSQASFSHTSTRYSPGASPFAGARMQFTYTPHWPGLGACCLQDGSCIAGQSLFQCTSAGGVYQGNGTLCSGQCPQPGACCLPDGSCLGGTTAAQCAAAGGVYLGASVLCSGQCPQPGACCLPNGTCVSGILPASCNAQGGFYQGAGTVCGNCSTPPVLFYTNCNISTGPMSLSGNLAPTGCVWSEVAEDEFNPSEANTVAGFNASGGNRIADNFGVPAGGAMIAYLQVYAYTNGLTAPSVTAATVRIWNGPPNDGGVVIFGDTVTNRLAANSFSNIYRIFCSAPYICQFGGTPPATGRRLQDVYIAVNQFLPAGTYWIDYDFTGASFSPATTQADAIGRQCNLENSNGLRLVGGEWVPLVDSGVGCAPVPYNQDIYFRLLATPAACYPNCDSSTTAPCLNIQDFSCFLNRFAAGDTYANCDASTIPPVLNVQDFSCFLNKFAVGCSGC